MDAGERCWVHVIEEDGLRCNEMDEGDDGEGARGDCCGCGQAGLALFGVGGLSAPVQAEAVSSAGKIELHHVLNSFQNSPEYGVHVCETFKDPRRYVIDAYWDDVREEAFSIDELHHVVGGVGSVLTDGARAKLHQFARALERLSKRIDRVVHAV